MTVESLFKGSKSTQYIYVDSMKRQTDFRITV